MTRGVADEERPHDLKTLENFTENSTPNSTTKFLSVPENGTNCRLGFCSLEFQFCETSKLQSVSYISKLSKFLTNFGNIAFQNSTSSPRSALSSPTAEQIKDRLKISVGGQRYEISKYSAFKV